MKFRIGQAVSNRKRPEWGDGEIVELSDTAATVIFALAGERKMAVSFLEPVESTSLNSRTGGEKPDSENGRSGAVGSAPGSLAFEAELRRRLRKFLTVANKAGIEKIEEKINQAFLRGENWGLQREIESQLRRWVKTNPRGRHAHAIPAARALYDFLFLSTPLSPTESPALLPSTANLSSTYSLAVVSLLAQSPLLKLSEGERPHYRIEGEEVRLDPSVEVLQPGQVPVFRRWQDRLILLAGDERHADLLRKVSEDKFGTLYENAPRIASSNSEDAVTWSIMRTLERRGPARWLHTAMQKGLARAGNDQAAASFPEDSPRFAFWQKVPPPPSLATPEGSTEFDVLAFVGEGALVSIEAKVGAALSSGTTYDPTRNQFIRTLDVGSWFAEQNGISDYFPAILLPDGNREDIALVRRYVEDPSQLAAALPHRDTATIEHLAKKIAILTWEDILEIVLVVTDAELVTSQPAINPSLPHTEETVVRSAHPLVTRSQEKDVTAVTRFSRTAREISVQQLSDWFQQEVAAAPNRRARGKPYFVGHDGIPGTGDFTNRGEEHLAIALFNAYSHPAPGLVLPSGEVLSILDYQFPLKARLADRGIGKIDLLGALISGRLCVIELKRMSSGSPETPLRALLEGLAYAAIIEANVGAIAAEARSHHDIDISHEKPMVMVLAPRAYWDYFRVTPQARSWDSAMREMADKVENALEIPVLFVGLKNCEVSPGLRGQPATLLRPVETYRAI